MPNVLILTDGAAQFASNTYPGCERVHILPWRTQVVQQAWDVSQPSLSALPASLRDSPLPATAPSEQDFFRELTVLGQEAHEIVMILTSSHLSAGFRAAQDAIQTIHCPAAIHLIDSQNIGAGLGLLVQSAAQVIDQGATGMDVYRYLHKLVPHTYSLFCIQSLTYLGQAGHLDPAQALVGEMLNLLPFFLLETGRLTPVQKVRSSRQLIEVVCEFIAEFESLSQIVLTYGVPPFDQEVRLLCERLEHSVPVTAISAQVLNNTVAAVFGPRSLGVSVMEVIEV